MAHFQDGFIGRLQWNCTLKETEALSLCTDSHLPPALLSLCQMVERRFFYKVTWLPLFLYGAGVTLPSDPISGDSRKMDGARDLGMYSFVVVVVVVCVCASFFFLPRCWYFSSRFRWDRVDYPVECASRTIGYHQTTVYTSEIHCHNNVAGSLFALVDT